jgi:hypothetical protein
MTAKTCKGNRNSNGNGNRNRNSDSDSNSDCKDKADSFAALRNDNKLRKPTKGAPGKETTIPW